MFWMELFNQIKNVNEAVESENELNAIVQSDWESEMELNRIVQSD